MKRFMYLPFVILMASILFFSCEDEPTDPSTQRPLVSLSSSSDLTVDPEEVFSITFSASKGSDSDLNAVTVYEDGVKVSASRLTVNGTAAAANAILLFGDDKEQLDWTIDIVAQSTASSVAVYEVEVQDEASLTSSVSVTVTTAGTPPTLTSTTPMIVETNQDIKNSFGLTGLKGSGDLVSIEVRRDGVPVDVSNIFWIDIAMPVASNPFDLSDTQKDGFEDLPLFIMTPAEEGTFTYSVVLMDEFGLSDELIFEVTTLPNGTDVDMLMGVLLNAAGPDGTGGLDLDTGMGTDSDDSEAEIKDNGINTDLPPEDNWLRTISPIEDNGVSMKYVRAGENGVPEGFTFESIQFKEDLPGLFDNGVELTDGSSDVVQPGDVFIVSRADRYYALEVIEVVTEFSNNEDSYTFDVKY